MLKYLHYNKVRAGYNHTIVPVHLVFDFDLKWCVLEYVYIYYSMVQCIEVHCSAVQYILLQCNALQHVVMHCIAVQCSSVQCSVV